jgi:hypothetical protein
MEKRYIICSAIKYNDHIIHGRRHGDAFQTLERFLSKEISEYIHDIDDKTAQTLYDAEAENLETLKLSDDIWEFNAFSDSYEGCRVSLTSDGDKLKLVSWEVIDEEECEVEGMSDSKIYKLLN